MLSLVRGIVCFHFPNRRASCQLAKGSLRVRYSPTLKGTVSLGPQSQARVKQSLYSTYLILYDLQHHYACSEAAPAFHGVYRQLMPP